MNEEILKKKLEERKAQHSFRQLRLPKKGIIDFCSNDYLGIVKNNLLHVEAGNYSYGATGSRLLTGNYSLVEETEAFIASFHQSESAIIFNSGYDANVGLLSCVPQKGDTVLYDSLSHASIRDGIRLSFAESYSFRHNDLDDLDNKLKKAKGNVFVVTESVFSMDGDKCPLAALVKLCDNYGAYLIIDEAHATGIIGDKGEGLVQQFGLQDKVFARVYTFGKACGVHGASVVGSRLLRDYLVNFARSFVYTTALPGQAIALIRASYELFPGMVEAREKLWRIVETFNDHCLRLDLQVLKSDTPIQGVIIPGNERVRRVADQLQAAGLDSRPILYPTVPRDQERLRIVLHAFNTEKEVNQLLNCLKNSL